MLCTSTVAVLCLVNAHVDLISPGVCHCMVVQCINNPSRVYSVHTHTRTHTAIIHVSPSC